MDLSSKTICVVDRGTFTSWASKMTEYFGRVYLYTEWKEPFPKSNLYSIGMGLKGVTRVHDFFDIVDKTDCFFFPDVYDGDLQLHLQSLGKPVFGSFKGEELELERWKTKKLFKKLGLPVQPVTRVFGMDDLRTYLQYNKEKYIKVNLLRGDCETYHHINYFLSEPWLDDLERRLGLFKYDKEFILEDPVDPAIEIGYDGYSIRGEWPDKAIIGFEAKDAAFAGVVRDYKDFPECLTHSNQVLAPILANYGYQNCYSSEVRVTPAGTDYLLDPCCRSGSPPSELYQELISNWGDIIFWGSQGVLVNPETVEKWGVQAALRSEWAIEHDLSIEFPKEISKWVKLASHRCVEGKYQVVGREKISEIGSVIAIDDTLLGAIKKLREYSDKISAFRLEVRYDSLADAVEEMHKAQDQGIDIDKDLPSIEEVDDALNL